MDNKKIAEILEKAVFLMELNDVNQFKVSALRSAVWNIDRHEKNLSSLAKPELEAAVGKSVLPKIVEIIETGTLAEYEDLKSQTPEGVLEIAKIKGLGAKKVKTLWKDLGITDTVLLKEACLNGTIEATKGFGAKTKEGILTELERLESTSGHMLYAEALQVAEIIQQGLAQILPIAEIAFAGDLARSEDIVTELAFTVSSDDISKDEGAVISSGLFEVEDSDVFSLSGKLSGTGESVKIYWVEPAYFQTRKLLYGAHSAHLSYRGEKGSLLEKLHQMPTVSEAEVYQAAGIKFVIPEMRQGHTEFEWLEKYADDVLLEPSHIKGPLHNHSLWSDGANTLEEMALASKVLGYSYFGIADHSQTASYANGLDPERVAAQQKEIDALNANLRGVKIIKGIESDIKPDGSLDYENDVLDSFDYVVASIHSGLSMTIEKATERLLTAIYNPYTSIVGHLTGRLHLKRDGYPVDYGAIIKACAETGTAIEINAHPVRLDIDWRWVKRCMDEGVMLSINPDAHYTEGLKDVAYGVIAGRKGGLLKRFTLNTLETDDLLKWFKDLKTKKLNAQ